MLIQFPKNFIWGTSTAAPQIETAFDHDWVGVKSKDGFTFGRTSDHEKRRTEDLQYICQLGNAYRMSLDWSRLQREPYGKFVPEVVSEYRALLAKLEARNKYIIACSCTILPILIGLCGQAHGIAKKASACLPIMLGK
ncbi:MAG: family 1 glycosylhydrolase [Sphingobacteriales bacterium]|nr:family 1 glycosylhydrolase [Sphingobacteriales bacterium]